MKYIKILALVALAGAALTAFAGIASATVTSGGWAYTGTIKASSTNLQLDGSVTISCANSTVEGSTSFGATSGTATKLNASECGTTTVAVIGTQSEPYHGGTFSIESNGTVKSTGANVTTLTHSFFLGTTHCIYKTNNTNVGTLTEGVSPAVVHIGSALIPDESTDGLCGNDAELTGDFTVNTPSGAITVD